MRLSINDIPIFVATGGREFDAGLPTLVFLHGSGLDHRSWALQTRWFAFNGYSVVAPDFPGHSLSGGQPLTSIEAMADWVVALLDELNVNKASLVGHSQGALVALDLAGRHAERVASLSVVAAAAAIGVNPQLLQLAAEDQPAAVDAMLSWGFGSAYQFGRSHVPGQAPLAVGSRIMGANPLAVDLQACQDYTAGQVMAGQVRCPAQLVLATQDRMTPLKVGRALAERLPDVRRVEELEAGHMLPIEAPDDTLSSVRAFITSLS